MTSREDREDGVENRQAKRDRDKFDWLGGVIRRIQWSGHVLANARIQFCSRNSPQPSLNPPKSEWHDGQRQINEAGKYIRENTALRTKFRDSVRVHACQSAVCLEFAFCRLGVMRGGALIGQRTWRLMT